MRGWLSVVMLLVLVGTGVGAAVASPSNGLLAAVPTPTGAHPATIYSVRNLDTQTLNVHHTIKDSGGTIVYEFTDTLAVGQTHEFHVSQMSQIPTPFQGTLDLTVDSYLTDPPIAAEVSGYDYVSFQTSLPLIRR